MKKLIPVILCCAMLLAACGSSADSAPAASESTSAAASSEAASSAESIIGGADGETDIVVSDEANTANLDAAVAAIEAVNPIANPRALDDFSVENELMLTLDNLVGYKGDVTNDQADCGLVFVAQAKDGKVDAVKAELEAYKESLSANDLYAEFADKVALAKDARIVTNGNYVAIVIAGIANPDYAPIDTALLTARAKAKLRGLLPLAAVLVNLGVLVYFKYANFLIDTVNQVAHLGLAALNIGTVLPLGISYYIFKIISYEVDVCTGKIAPEKNFITFAVYVLFFPQLIVGPIVKYREMADQLHDGANRCTPARAEHGAELFVFGLAKKVILADSIGALWTDIIGAGGVGLTNVSTPLAWLGIIAYSLQLYFDFAGYSEMSNGLAALLGFDCPANFNLPYISGSITEFWRRWHITLSGWFRDYIYIPLGGNRKGQARQLLNMFLVWAATGIWHGASWNFIAWGLYYFVLLTIEKTFLLKYLKKGKVWPHIYTLFFVVLGWGIFTANQPGAPLGLLLQKLFVPQGGISPVYYLRNYGVLLVLGCVCSSALPHWLWEKISKNTVAKLLVFALLTALCVCYVVAATNATALYANF